MTTGFSFTRSIRIGGLGSPSSTLSAHDASYLGHLHHLYAIDASRNAVDEYRVNEVDGALTPCSPFSFGAASGAPAGLAFVFPGDSNYMYVGDTNGTISVFDIGNPVGTVRMTIAGSPFAVGEAPVNLLCTWWSPTLYAADLRKNVIFVFYGWRRRWTDGCSRLSVCCSPQQRPCRDGWRPRSEASNALRGA